MSLQASGDGLGLFPWCFVEHEQDRDPKISVLLASTHGLTVCSLPFVQSFNLQKLLCTVKSGEKVVATVSCPRVSGDSFCVVLDAATMEEQAVRAVVGRRRVCFVGRFEAKTATKNRGSYMLAPQL